MKRLVLVGLVVAAFAPVTANAAVPCRDRIYNDWYADGKIATTYSPGCYRDALKNVPPDARIYSSLADDIRSAMRGAQARSSGHKGVPEQIGKGIEPAAATVPTKTRPTKTTKTTKTTSSHQPPTRMQPVSQAPPTSTLAAADSSGSSSGVPVPLIVLGALALLLIAVGAAGAVVKRRRI